ncbi:MAG: MFS transporter [Planctomycetota bacterium]|nr:MFS transporter [Planctomycetota bacterium]
MSTRIRLSTMMFLQYMLIAVWFVQLTAYVKKLGMGGLEMALIGSSMALGCLASPLIGMFADRNFASQKVLAALNLATCVLLLLSAQVTAPFPLFLLLLAAMLCYMPTWGLTSSIAMSHSPAEKFPQIRVFGSIGWVAAGLFSIVAEKVWGAVIDGTAIPLYCGAGVALAGGVFALLLPHTPPPAKGQKTSIVDVMGLRSLALMKDWHFAVLVLGYLIATIPFSAHWTYGAAFLEAKAFKYLTVTMNWGQFVEMFLMLLVPVAIARGGLKWTMVVGLLALLVRYGAYALGNNGSVDTLYYKDTFPAPVVAGLLGNNYIVDAYIVNALYYTAILVHGIIFGFFYVGAQIYVDRKAPKEMKAQAQGLLFLIFGVGLLVGNFANGWLIEANTVTEGAKKIINWQPMWLTSTAISAVLLVLFALLFRDPVAAKSAEAAKPGEA